ncbi:FAD-binding domain-containing protein [Podospora didyma]|uniref:FAD-binding domain-containing protein n=1 Tax=Podospora didyma TaxID=330526 RepID=A0AAE0P4U8_9PEZI|nr:FAD-binding domain-containing protein [Podospora didyma]
MARKKWTRADSISNQHHHVVAADQTQYLTDAEIAQFLDDLDHNGDGLIDYEEVAAKLDAAHDELVPSPSQHHFLARRNNNTRKDEEEISPLDIPPESDLRHQFLRSIIGSDSRAIPRAEFAERVKEWKIPSLELEHQKNEQQGTYVRKMSVYRRLRAYWAVHGPEIVFLALVVWSQTAFGSWQLTKYLRGEYYTAAFGWGVVMAKAAAGALYPTMFFLIFSMSRYCSTLLRRSYYLSRFINWDLSQSFHIKIAVVFVSLATLHAIGHLSGTFYTGSEDSRQAAVDEVLGKNPVLHSYDQYLRSRPGWTGLTALGLIYLLALLSLPPVRRWNYEVFQLGHLLMFPIIALLIAHGSNAMLQYPMLGYWIAFPTLLIVIERVVRVMVGFYRIEAVLKVLDAETVEITTTVPSERLWGYKAGQYVFLQVPAISLFQWHPFTVSVCSGKKMQLHIKTNGNWTKRLRALGGENGQAKIEVGINGPFGAPAQRFYDFRHTIIVGSGIGVTPFSGILADLQARDNQRHGGPGHVLDRSCMCNYWSDSSKPLPKSEKSDTKNCPLMNKLKKRKQNQPGPQQQGHKSNPSFASNVTTTATSGGGGGVHSEPDDYRRVDFHWTVRERNYLLWMSDLLNDVFLSQIWHRRHEERPHLDIRIHTHVTQKRASIATHVYCWLLEMHRTAAHPESPITGLMNPTLFGRPDFVTILDQHYDDMRKFRAGKRADRERWRARRVRRLAAGMRKRTDQSTATMASASTAGGRAFSGGLTEDDETAAEEELKIGVFYCGAPAVGEILADRCRALTARGRTDGSKMEYHFMTEVFA